jgi:DMSO/TMAO reductase YedYZ molybdopterin-dependent catalytic subunit
MRRTREAGIGLDELAQAARNHGMPLEALRADVTPPGMHYVLVHYDVPFVDAAAHTIAFEGFDRPLELALDDLRARPAVTMPITFECAGNGRALFETRAVSQPWLLEAVGTGEWTGTALSPLLREAGVPSATVEVLFTGLDRGIEGGRAQAYERALPLAEAMRDDVLLVYEMNGRPLPPQHGAPLRLIVPGWYGMTHVKWLTRLTVLDQPFDGFQHRGSYLRKTSEEDPGTPVTRMLPRSLMVPPGVPDFATRTRFVRPGPCELLGRAWSGHGAIERVEVSTDGGESWADAELDPPLSEHAWRGWRFTWDAGEPGAHELCSRATDAAGNGQPLEPDWDLLGMANNPVQRMPVVVDPEAPTAAG